MSKKISSMQNLINMFEQYVDEDDIISAQLLSQISSSIVKFRIEKKMNQKEFAQFLGISQAMVSKIESSDYNFTIRKLVELCNKMDLYLNVSIKSHKVSMQQNKYIIFNMENYEKSYEELDCTKKKTNKEFSVTKKSVCNSQKWFRC